MPKTASPKIATPETVMTGIENTFAPIAIVGRSCVLPGALNPSELWQRVRAGDDLTSHAPAGRWRVPYDDVYSDKPGDVKAAEGRTWTDIGGYVRGFEKVFDPHGFLLPADEIQALDPVFQWTMHTVREALRSAGRDGSDAAAGERTGLVMGNLSFPSATLAEFAEHHWLGANGLLSSSDDTGPTAHNRFNSGLPATLTASALGLGAGALSLDAACASSLYAIKLACDRLHRGDADTMVAGAVSAADDLFIHIGFCALSAMSRSGLSRPFHRDADGLLPAEGAAFVVLRRLEDAVAAGETILGVIRGVGLSNDGKDRGLLAPSQVGQERAIRAAWQMAGLNPHDVGMIECHATGTSVGDGTEVKSMATVFNGATDLPLGSLKSNMGHLITAAGAAGLLKVLGAMEHDERPPTRFTEAPIDELSGSPFRLLTEVEPWTGPKRATVSAFGFGGNNAHLIVEAFDEAQHTEAAAVAPMRPAICIVGVGARVGQGEHSGDLLKALLDGETASSAREQVVVDLKGLRVPPNDLKQTLAQQLLVLEAAREAVGGLDLPLPQTGIVIGMGTDPAVARYGIRWRLAARLAEAGHTPDAAWLSAARDAIIAPLKAAGVLGTMPNVPANRVGSQLDLRAAGFTVSAEEASGIEALRIAQHALETGEMDAALVGAVDLSHNAVHQAARAALNDNRAPGDAAVVLVLRRLSDAQEAGEPVLAILDDVAQQPGGEDAPQASDVHISTAGQFGHAHAATALVDVAAAALAVGYGFKPQAGEAASTWVGPRAATVTTPVMSARPQQVRLRSAAAQPLWTAAPLEMRIYAAGSKKAVLAAARAGKTSTLAKAGKSRLVLTGTAAELPSLTEAAIAAIEGGGPLPRGAAFQAKVIAGPKAGGRAARIQPAEIASIFTGAAAAYEGMGSDITRAFPHLVEQLRVRTSQVVDATRWTFEGGARHPLDQLWGTTYLCQLHTLLLQELAGLRPDATLGYSSGETNAMFAYGAWNDFDEMMVESRTESLLTRDLAGTFDACRTAWNQPDATWQAISVMAPLVEVRTAVAEEANAHITIINTNRECVVGGESAAVGRVKTRLGAERCFDLDYPMAAHCPEIGHVRDAWRQLHLRPVDANVGVRYYSNGFGSAFELNSDAVADGITAQALATLDLPRTILQMWQDGVRVFVEHGPRAACTGWIKRILKDRPHVAIALDRAGRNGVRQAAQALAELVAAGVPCEPAPFFAHLADAAQVPTSPGLPMCFPAHAPAIELPPLSATKTTTAAAPQLRPAHHSTTSAPSSRTTSPLTPAAPPVSNLGEVMQPAPALPSMLTTLLAHPSGQALPYPADQTTMQAPAPHGGPGRPSVAQAAAPRVKVAAPTPTMGLESSQATAATVAAPPKPTRRGAPAPTSASVVPRPTTAAPQTPTSSAASIAATKMPAPAPRASTTVPGPSLPVNNAATALADIHRQLAEMHQNMLKEQAALHAQFLEGRAAALAFLASAGASQPVHRPVSPVTPAAADATSAPHAVAVASPLLTPAAQSVHGGTPAVIANPVASASSALTTPAGTVNTSVAPRLMPVTKPASDIVPVNDLPGPKYSRAQLEVLSSGKISEVFGAAFADQDDYVRQVRMPTPPLLLADRVTGIDAEPHSMGLGTIWTETDVCADSWYLGPDGRMPGGVMIESGQADLLLISWLGVDRFNQSDRVYRLLGCELAYHGELPKAGETLQYDIHVDGHAQQGDVRLFFFHYNCRVNGELRLSVKGGQAGFFTDAELADSGGVLWSPDHVKLEADLPLDMPHPRTRHTSLTRAQLEAFADGNPYGCFGAGFETTQAHSFSPRIGVERMLFLDKVTHLEALGGTWKRGYLRAEQKISPDDWFFDGHFKNDPCMPGTLMFEGCLQTMAIYLASLGYTIERDGWRFQPVTDERYLMRCRGQVIPSSQLLVYELFVREVIDGPEPTLFADVLCTVDGLKAFHAGRVGVRLVPAWPLDIWRDKHERAELLLPEISRADLPPLGGMVDYKEPKPVAVVDGFSFDYASLIACGWGRPSEAFGAFYSPFDNHRRVARLPGPPYLFMSRIVSVEGEIGCMKAGISVVAEYDIPEDCWYFAGNGAPAMPLAVLMEAALQPCGWLSSYVGGALTADHDLLFRNLDGTGTMHTEVRPGSGPLETRVKLLSLAQSAGMLIVSFDVQCLQGETLIFDMNTVFGFFPKESFVDQAGLPVKPAQREAMTAPGSNQVDLVARPVAYCGGSARLADPMLLMIDRVTDWQPTGGKEGIGRARAEKTIDPAEWFFKAHFFQDPVQPGSLGIEAMAQLLQWVMLERGMHQGVVDARFEPIMTGRPLTWKYRGQVVPSQKLIQSEVDLIEVGVDDLGPFAVADCSLWVDGKRIYHAKGMGMRIVSGGGHPTQPSGGGGRQRSRRSASSATVVTLDPESDLWLCDHRPTWTVPTLPMMSMVDLLAGEGTNGRPTVLRDVRARSWLRFDADEGTHRARRVRVVRSASAQVGGQGVVLEAWRDAANAALSRFEPIASGTVSEEALSAAPTAWPALKLQGAGGSAEDAGDPYTSGRLFHGPAFQCLTSWRVAPEGASATLDVGRLTVPRGHLNQGLLDAMTHVIPHDGMHVWSSHIPATVAAYPHRVAELRLFDHLPDSGEMRLEARFAGFSQEDAGEYLPLTRFPVTDVQLIDVSGAVQATLRLVEVLLPKGRLGETEPLARQRFLTGRSTPGVSMSIELDGLTTLSRSELRTLDWLPGTVAQIYQPQQSDDIAVSVAAAEHVARRAAVHPATVRVTLHPNGRASAVAAMRPFRRYELLVTATTEQVTVRDAALCQADFSPARKFWAERLGLATWPVADLFFGLVDRFVRDVVMVDPSGLEAYRGKGCIFVANHQVGIESLLFSLLSAALTDTPVVTVAKKEHRDSWLGELIAAGFAHPSVEDPGVITFFDRQNAGSLLELAAGLSEDLASGRKHVMVHVAGTRSLAARTPVSTIAGNFIDLAVQTGAAIVPVRFLGGLPVEPMGERLDFPVGLGQQDYWIGQPIPAEMLASLPLKDRRDLVLHALNHLGPDLASEVPLAPSAELQHAVMKRATQGLAPTSAVLQATLANLSEPCDETATLLAGSAGTASAVDGEHAAWQRRFARALQLPSQ